MGTTLIEQRRNGANLSRLTDQQQVFVLELLADDQFSPTAAARKAGYKNPSQAANKLLKNRVVCAALGKAQRERVERLGIDADRVLQEVAYCALRDPLDMCDENGRIIVDDLSQLPEQARRAIDGIKVRRKVYEDGTIEDNIELKLVPKIQALELAMKHLGLLAPQQHQITHAVDWDSLYVDGTENSVDEIEARIAEVGK